MSAANLIKHTTPNGERFEASVSCKPADSISNMGWVTFDARLSNVFRLTLVGNVTLHGPSNGEDCQRVIVILTQDGVGGRTLTLGTNISVGTDLATVTLSSAVGAIDYLGLMYNAVTGDWHVVSFIKGFS